MVTRNEGPPSEKPGPAPEAPGAAARRATGQEPGKTGYEEDEAFKQADWSAAEPLDLRPEAGGWKLSPDPAPDAAAKISARLVTLKGGNGGVFDATKQVVVARSAPLAFVAHVNALPGQSGQTSVEKIDLTVGKSLGVHPVTQNTALMDAGADGKRVLLRSDEFGFGKKDRLEVWAVEGAALKRMLIFFPYSDGDWTARDVEAALFVGPAHVLTVSRKGKLGLWDISGATPKATYTATLAEGTKPALSPGGKYLAVEVGRLALILDPLTGKTLAELPLEASAGGPGASYAFSPSGK